MGGNRSIDRLGIDHLPHVCSNDIQSGRRIPIQTWCSFGGLAIASTTGPLPITATDGGNSFRMSRPRIEAHAGMGTPASDPAATHRSSGSRKEPR
jgi:hypothetical protein